MNHRSNRRPSAASRTGRAYGPFGEAQLISGRALQRFSFAGRLAAENLLSKARRALDDHDSVRAGELVDRAVRVPFDEHEQVWPAAMAVHMHLFDAVTDAMEQASQDDSRWLDAAVEVLGHVDERAACELRGVLVVIDQDYAISPDEHRRIGAAIAQVPDRASLYELELEPAQLRENVMSVLAGWRAYDEALETRLASTRPLPQPDR